MASRAGGTLSGAGSGALVGSAFGPIGTATGGILGGILGYLSKAKDPKNKQVSTMLPEQQDYLKNLLSQLQGMQQGVYGQSQDYLSGILSGDPQAYEQFAAPYRTEFEQQTIPMLAERFAGLTGAMGNPNQSSGFAQALGGAGAGLESNLANLFANLRQNAASQAMGQYNQLAGYGLNARPFENTYTPGNLGFGGEAASGLLQGVGTGFGQGFGVNLSNKFGNMFNSNLPTK